MKTAMKIILALVMVLAYVAPAQAQDEVTVSARISSERAFVGDPVELEIVVDGSTDAQPPDLDGLDGISAEYLGDENRSMTSMSIVNGRRSQTETIEYVFRYALTPQRTGPLTIPPVSVLVDGKVFKTQPVWLEAVGAEANEDFVLTVRPAATRLYVGQAATLKFTWYIGASVSTFRFSGPESGGAYELVSPEDPRSTRPGANPRAYLDFTFLDHPAVSERGEGRYQGRSFQTLTFDQVLIPRQAGTLRFGPINLAFDQVVGQSRDIFARAQTRRVVIASEAVDFDVLELPSAGRPADFFGLVGDYSLEATASPLAASVGDPIALTVRIRGPEPLTGVQAPELSAQEGFVDAFKLASEGWTEIAPSAPGERAFTTTVRARDASVAAIPAVAIPCFDPDRGEYRRAASSPIPLVIEPTTEVTAADAIVAPGSATVDSSGPRLATLERLPLGDGPGGIVEGARGMDQLTVDEPDAARWATGPIGVALLAGPVIVFLGATLWGPVRCAWRSPLRRSLAKAERAIRRASGASSPDAIGDAVRGYVGRMTGRAPEALTARDCASLAAQQAPRSAAELAMVLDDCEGARYGRRAVEGRTLAGRAVEALRRLDAEIRRTA